MPAVGCAAWSPAVRAFSPYDAFYLVFCTSRSDILNFQRHERSGS